MVMRRMPESPYRQGAVFVCDGIKAPYGSSMLV